MKKIGPIEFLHGDKSPTGATFRISTLGRAHEVRVDRAGETITARWTTDDDAGRVPVDFSMVGAGEAHGPLTLPHPTDVGWTNQPTSLSELTLAAGGDVAKWLGSTGATVSECDGHPCVHFPVSMLGTAVVAVAATRIRPVLTSHRFGEPPPWDVPPSVGTVRSTSSKGGGGSSSSETVVGRLELYPKLIEAVEEAVQAAGPCVEYGIVEHHFAYANVDDYRELHDLYGHIAVDHPMQSSMSGYLANLLGRKSQNDELRRRFTKGTGYWRYNSDISTWSLPGASDVPVTSWAEFAASTLGRHPAEWPAAALLWGEEPLISRSWSGHLGPGEAPPGLRLEDLPATSTDPGVRALAESFDAPSAFGTDLDAVVDRVRKHQADGLGLPRDLGMLRAALWAVHEDGNPDNAYVDALLQRMHDMF